MLECIRSLSSPEPSVLAAIEAAGCKRDDLITVIKNDVEDAVDFLCIQLSTPPEFHDSAMPSALRSLTSSALFYDESAFQEGVVHHARFTRSIPVVAKALASKFSVSFFSPVKPVVKRKRTFTSAQSFSLMGGGSALSQSQLSTVDCYADVSSQPGAVSKFLRRGSVENMEASNLDWTMMGGNSSNHVISGNPHRSSSQSGRTHSTSGSQLPAFAKKPMFMMSVSTAAKGSKVATMERGGGASKVKSFAQRSSAPSNMAMAGGSQSLLKRLQDVNIKAKSTVRAATFYGGMPSKTANGSGTVAKNNATITSTTAQSPSHMAFDDILMTPEKKRSRIGSKRTSLMHDVQHDAPGEDDVLVFETPARPTTRSSATKARRAILDDDEVVPDTPVVDRCA